MLELITKDIEAYLNPVVLRIVLVYNIIISRLRKIQHNCKYPSIASDACKMQQIRLGSKTKLIRSSKENQINSKHDTLQHCQTARWMDRSR